MSTPEATSGPVTVTASASIDRVGADHLVQPAVLGLGVPVGLDDDRVGTDAREVDAAAAAAGRCPRRRHCRRLSVPRSRRRRAGASVPGASVPGAIVAGVGAAAGGSVAGVAGLGELGGRERDDGRCRQHQQSVGSGGCHVVPPVRGRWWVDGDRRRRRRQPTGGRTRASVPVTAFCSQPKRRNTAMPSSDDSSSAPYV